MAGRMPYALCCRAHAFAPPRPPRAPPRYPTRVAWRRRALDHTPARALRKEGRACPPAADGRARFERLHVVVFGPVASGKSTTLHWLCRHAGMDDVMCRAFQVWSWDCYLFFVRLGS